MYPLVINEGNDDVIFLYKNSYTVLCQYVEKKREQGYSKVRIDLSSYSDDSFTQVLETIKAVSTDTDVSLVVI